MCSLEVRLDGDGAIASMRGHEADPLSRGHICPKAFALQDVHEDPDRLRRPVRRTADGGWREVSWDEAIGFAASRLVAVQREHGDDAVAVYQGNPNVHSLGALTHNPTLVRLLRTRNRFSATSVDQLPHHVVAWALYGHQFLLPVPDIDRTDLLVLVGHNPMASNGSLWTVPDFPQRRRELASRGGRLVVIDPRRTETAKVADEHHFVRPGSDAAVLLAVVRELLAGGARPAPPPTSTASTRCARPSRPFTPELAEQVSGMPADAVRGLARDLAAAPSAAVHGRMGVSTQAHGVVCQWAVQTINMLTGNLDRPGGTMLTTPAVDLVGRGVLGPGGFGKRRVAGARACRAFGGELPVSALEEEITTPGEGQVRALLTIAGNPVSSTPSGHRLDEALAGPRRDGVDRLLRQRDHPARRRHPAADRAARARPLRHRLPPARRARHRPVVAGAVRSRSRARGTTGRSRATSARALLRERSDGLRDRWSRATLQTEARLRLSPRRQLDALLRSSGARLSVAKLEGMAAGADRGAAQAPAARAAGDRRPPHRPRDPAGARVAARAARRAVGGAAGSATASCCSSAGATSATTTPGCTTRPGSPAAAPGTPCSPTPTTWPRAASATATRWSCARRWGRCEVEVAATDDVMPGVVSLPHGYGHRRPGVRLRHAETLPGVVDERPHRPLGRRGAVGQRRAQRGARHRRPRRARIEAVAPP